MSVKLNELRIFVSASVLVSWRIVYNLLNCPLVIYHVRLDVILRPLLFLLIFIFIFVVLFYFSLSPPINKGMSHSYHTDSSYLFSGNHKISSPREVEIVKWRFVSSQYEGALFALSAFQEWKCLLRASGFPVDRGGMSDPFYDCFQSVSQLRDC